MKGSRPTDSAVYKGIVISVRLDIKTYARLHRWFREQGLVPTGDSDVVRTIIESFMIQNHIPEITTDQALEINSEITYARRSKQASLVEIIQRGRDSTLENALKKMESIREISKESLEDRLKNLKEETKEEEG